MGTRKSAEPAVSTGGSRPTPRRGGSLIDSRFDHESCGVGFVATLTNEPSHDILTKALTALARLAHRGAVAADGKSSDGIGIHTAIPRALLLESVENGLAAYPDLFHAPAVRACLKRHLERQANMGYHLWGLMLLFLWMKRWQIQAAPAPAAYGELANPVATSI